MKYCILIVLLFGILNAAYSQNHTYEKKFIRSFYKDKGSIVYADALSKGILQEIKKALSTDTIRGFDEKNFMHDLIISRKERSQLNSQMNKLEDSVWINNVLDNSKMVDRHKIDHILKDRAYGWSNFNKEYGLGFHSFSKPIFIRNYTICIFYNDFSCPQTCGSGELAVYKKIHGNWKKWLILYNWIS